METKSANQLALENMLAAEELDRSFHELTEQDIRPLQIWVNEHRPPGQFLQAVLRNDLAEAAQRADLMNRRRLFEYVQWLYNNAPGNCWGSEEKFTAWIEKGELEKAERENNDA